jgi:hypothetical protein
MVAQTPFRGIKICRSGGKIIVLLGEAPLRDKSGNNTTVLSL